MIPDALSAKLLLALTTWQKKKNFIHVRLCCVLWRIQGEAVWATAPQTPVAPLSGACRSRNKDKITQSKVNSALHFV